MEEVSALPESPISQDNPLGPAKDHARYLSRRSRSRSRCRHRRPRLLEHTMSTTLPLFWHLSASSKAERLDASVKLISALEHFQAQFAPKDKESTSEGEEDEDEEMLDEEDDEDHEEEEFEEGEWDDEEEVDESEVEEDSDEEEAASESSEDEEVQRPLPKKAKLKGKR